LIWAVQLAQPKNCFGLESIVQDLIEVEDVSQPYNSKHSSDRRDFKVGGHVVWHVIFPSVHKSIHQRIRPSWCVGIYGSEHPVLAVVCDWWAQEMTYNANNNPLDEVFADFHAFDTIDEQGFTPTKIGLKSCRKCVRFSVCVFTIQTANIDWNNCFNATMRHSRNTDIKRDKTKIDSESVVSTKDH
jgi:hypothetical protein